MAILVHFLEQPLEKQNRSPRWNMKDNGHSYIEEEVIIFLILAFDFTLYENEVKI